MNLIAEVSAVASAFILMAVPAAAMNNIGGNYGNGYYSDAPQDTECTVSINAYCESGNLFIERAPCKIMDSSGQYLKFNSFLGTYNLTQSGGEELLYTDSSGGLTVELPPGQYTLVADNAGDYTVLESNIPFYIQSGAVSKNVDIEYTRLSGDLLLSLADADGNPINGGCSIQIEDASGNPVNFFSVGDNYSYTASTGKTAVQINSAVVSLVNFPIGSYSIKVTSRPAGSEPAMERYPFDINGSEPVSIEVQFVPEKTGQLSISNVDTSGSILTGSACSIVGADNVILTFTKVGGSEYKYDPNGIVNSIVFETSDPLYIVGLPLGVEYTVNEVNTSEGYVLSDPQKVLIDSEEAVPVILTAKKTTGSLSITVSDDTTNDKMADFSYTIMSAITKTPMYFVLKDATASNSTYIYSEQGEITAVKTGQTGTATIEGLPAGDIIIQCKESPQGYITDTTEITKTITPNVTALCDLMVSKSNVAIEVIDENESPIIDVPVEIYNSSGEIILTGQTNAKGKILLTNVAAGSYTYRLAGVPEGYSYIDDTKSFTILPSGIAEGLSEIRLERTKIQVSIGKQEGSNTLENAVFVLYDAAGNEISRVLTSSSGIATFTGVGYGDYTIKQITAPIGYSVSDKELNITINKKYTNEGVFDFSGDGDIVVSSGSDNSEDSPAAPSDNNDKKKKKSVSVGDMYFILIGILVVCFVGVAAVSFILKIKSNKSDADEPESPNCDPEPKPDLTSAEETESSSNERSHPIMFTNSNQPNKVDDEGVKIYTPPQNKVSMAPRPEDINLTGKTPEELKMMEEKIRALIAFHSDEDEGRKEEPSDE